MATSNDFFSELGVIGIGLCWLAALVFFISGGWQVGLVLAIPTAALTYIRFRPDENN